MKVWNAIKLLTKRVVRAEAHQKLRSSSSLYGISSQPCSEGALHWTLFGQWLTVPLYTDKGSTYEQTLFNHVHAKLFVGCVQDQASTPFASTAMKLGCHALSGHVYTYHL
eukprot:TRINITY_DN36923_c0_g1_i1.p2 TRINITY_DN36923_c0_g1~~TRINITY_DN36923_c0_g1_i1.p2  ORF type:complete len:110 (+),score=2.14 TRINITY_DN36923_c0_g1_i1:146-475(+)